LAKYLKDEVNEVLAERYLERIIGRMVDINYHILSAEHDESPADYFQSFLLMGRYKYLPVDFAEKVAKSAGLRNRLAHEYDAIDPKKVYKALTISLHDVPQYLSYIIKLIDKQGKRKRLH